MLDGRQHQRPHFERATRTHDADGYDFEGPTRSEFTIHRGRTRAALNDWFGSGDIGGAVADISASADEPSGEFAYANAGYHVLCGVIEAATGTDVAAALRTHVYDPGGLTETYLAGAESVPTPIVPGNVDLDGDGRDDAHLPSGLAPTPTRPDSRCCQWRS